MSSSRDDERLLDALLADARESPRPEDLGRVEHRLQDWLSPDAAPPVRPGARALRSSKVLKPVLVIVGLGLMARMFLSGSTTAVSGDPPGAASVAPPSGVPVQVTELAPEATPKTTVSVADLPEATEARALPHAPPNDVPPPSAVVRPRPAVPTSRPGPSAIATKPLAADEAEESEASFLHRTRAALASDPARALRMTEEHVSRYPHGVLVQERDVIAIDALVRLGRRDEARSRASAFQTRYPKSAHASRIAAILEKEAP